MDSSVLLGVLIATYAGAQLHLLRVDAFFAAAYFYLFVYGVFAVVGYLYFPDLSRAISAYFGPEVASPILVFLILSFISIYLVLAALGRVLGPPSGFIVAGRFRFNYVAPTMATIGVLTAVQIGGLASFGASLNYSNVGDIDFYRAAGLWYKVWFSLFKMSPVVLSISYAVLRYGLWGPRNAVVLALGCVVQAATLFFTCYMLGNRTDLIATFNAFVFIELIHTASTGGKVGRTAVRLAGMATVALFFLNVIESVRSDQPEQASTLAEQILFKDYYAPAHILFAAVANNIVDLGEVLKSNTMNAMILMDYPYLQEFVTETFNPGVTSRYASYAFYILSEGYLALGGYGFIYNALVIGLGLFFWRQIANTSSARMNALILPVLALDLANISRSQSAYFIKYLYFHLLPALLFIFLSTGYYVRLLARGDARANVGNV